MWHFHISMYLPYVVSDLVRTEASTAVPKPWAETLSRKTMGKNKNPSLRHSWNFKWLETMGTHKPTC